jgi:hypothetical protein
MDDETRFMSFARRAAELCGYPVGTWSVTLGLARDGNASQVDTQEPQKALAFVRRLQAPAVYVFHDLRPHLGDPVVVRHLKEFTFAERAGQTILITGPDATVPKELEGVALPWTLEPPARDEVEPLVRATITDLTQRGLAVALTDADVQEMVTACLGLTLPEIERLILRQAMDDEKLDAADVKGGDPPHHPDVEDARGDRRGPPHVGPGACHTRVRPGCGASRGGGATSRLRLSELGHRRDGLNVNSAGGERLVEVSREVSIQGSEQGLHTTSTRLRLYRSRTTTYHGLERPRRLSTCAFRPDRSRGMTRVSGDRTCRAMRRAGHHEERDTKCPSRRVP